MGSFEVIKVLLGGLVNEIRTEEQRMESRNHLI